MYVKAIQNIDKDSVGRIAQVKGWQVYPMTVEIFQPVLTFKNGVSAFLIQMIMTLFLNV